MDHLSALLAGQNPDGGWGYSRGSSWTEPTVFALLALSAAGHDTAAETGRALSWLRASQRDDGGWPPQPGVKQSTWVTTLPLLLAPQFQAGLRLDPAVSWLVAENGAGESWVGRLRSALIGAKHDVDISQTGWPWFPGTASWVGPTSYTVLALERLHANPRALDRARQGRSFLLSRRCADQGWNHGSYHALGYGTDSYPETTGLALLALHADHSPALEPSLQLADRFLAQAHSREAACWLQLGLLSHGRPASLNLDAYPAPRSTIERSLTIISEAAAGGHNVFLSAA